MKRHLTYAIAAAAMLSFATPGAAQDEPEEARTTYQVTYLKFAAGADERWNEMMEDHFKPARKAAGLPEAQIHWLMDGPWDIMMVTRMPRGLAALDTHAGPERTAFEKALLAQAGSEDAVTKINDEYDKLIAENMRVFSHTHP